MIKNIIPMSDLIIMAISSVYNLFFNCLSIIIGRNRMINIIITLGVYYLFNHAYFM